ncbi:uncharacterized protein LOC117791470 [Drosophila innubila]|uniref:uncharacterized protein LOC117791470 n=1 Tax=Drosophila innubila TaxID=198719 RepID=UPI00148C9480|nr:uncharacterized protein LOC117791470 [Drosophila innubila]
MKIMLFSILFLILAMQADAGGNCEKTLKLESTCGSYCYKVVRPFLDHMKALQQKTEDKDDGRREKLEKIEEKCGKAEKNYDELERSLQSKWEKLEGKIELELKSTQEMWKNFELKIKQELEEVKTLQQSVIDTYDYLEQTLSDKFESLERTIGLQSQNLQVTTTQKPTPRQVLAGNAGNGQYYVDDNNRVNFHEAKRRCEQLGGYLRGDVSLDANAIIGVYRNRVFWTDGVNGDGKCQTTIFARNIIKIRKENCQIKRNFICSKGN